MTHSGLDRSGAGELPPVARADAATYVARLADRVDGLHVVALGPLTELAEVQRRHPASYARLAGVISMAGIVDSPSHDDELGVGEWNAAADVDAFAAVVAGDVPLTIVPDDPVPPGRPDGLTAPVVERAGPRPRVHVTRLLGPRHGRRLHDPGRGDGPDRHVGRSTSRTTAAGSGAPATDRCGS